MQDESKPSDANVPNPTDLNLPGARTQTAKRIHHEINVHTAQLYDDGPRWRLGASNIGNECKRELWYGYRWVYRKPKDGRQLRLLNRGHREEPLHAEWLRGIGFTVWTHGDDGNQLRINNICKGHLGGSLDGILAFPPSWNIPGNAILESKTSATGAKFNIVNKEPLAISKPTHFVQNSIYGRAYNIENVVYICGNKNDDDLAIKVEKLDFNLAQQMEDKAASIIFSQTPPEKISENPTFEQCKYVCDFKDVCHHGKPADKNCRSCVNAYAIDDAQFHCSKWNATIPREAVPDGCQEWQSIIVVSVVKMPTGTGMFEVENVPLPK